MPCLVAYIYKREIQLIHTFFFSLYHIAYQLIAFSCLPIICDSSGNDSFSYIIMMVWMNCVILLYAYCKKVLCLGRLDSSWISLDLCMVCGVFSMPFGGGHPWYCVNSCTRSLGEKSIPIVGCPLRLPTFGDGSIYSSQLPIPLSRDDPTLHWPPQSRTLHSLE
jgi:hypothetical protein